MDLGTNLKQLRKEKELTQEELAECLNVAPQTVSKWENNLSMPDISFLPVLADYFGITVDALLRNGVECRDNAMKMQAKEVHALVDSGKIEEAYKKLKDSMANWALSTSMNHLMSWTAYQLSKDFTSDDKIKLLEEAIMYANRAIRLDSGESSRTAQAKMTKCYCMVEMGRKAEAIKIANTLPSMFSSRERVLAKISEGDEKKVFAETALTYIEELKEELSCI